MFLDVRYATRLGFNNVKPKELVSIHDRIRMCKTNHVGLPHVVAHVNWTLGLGLGGLKGLTIYSTHLYYRNNFVIPQINLRKCRLEKTFDSSFHESSDFCLHTHKVHRSKCYCYC